MSSDGSKNEAYGIFLQTLWEETPLNHSLIEKGAGQPLVFLHGIGGNAETWTHQLDTCAHHHHCIALDLPGYGGSESLPQMTFPALARWLYDLLVQHDLDQPILVGHSIGGMIIQQYLADYPDGAKAAVLYATSPAFGPKDGKWQRKFIRDRLSPLDQGITMAQLAPAMAQKLIGSGAKPEGIALARQGLAAVPVETFRAAVMCLVNFDQRENLEHIRIPCLVIAGDEDTNAPPQMMERMASRIPTAEFVLLPWLGHLAHLENPSLFNTALESFLGRLP